MIETILDCNRFRSENVNGDWVLHVVPVKDGVHAVINLPSILFVRNIFTKKTYFLALDHPDSRPAVSTIKFIKDFLFNNKNRKWVLDKKSFLQLLNIPGILDANLINYIENNEILIESDYETTAHFLVRKHGAKHEKLNLAIPLVKHKEMFDDLADDITNLITKYERDDSFIRFNELIIGTLGELESQGIFVDRKVFEQRFGIDVGPMGIVHSQYNVYTSTGRPSNHFGGVNYAALNSGDGTRKCFRSRWGDAGRMVLIDYTAFHPRIVAHLTKYPITTETDIYEYLAKLYFHKKVVDETDVKNSKNLTFRQLYGGVEDKYSHIKYLSNLKSFIDSQWDFFQHNGYVLTPLFKRKITKKHIIDPNPPKLLNYILQAVEGEISIPRVREILDYLHGKKTKAIMYIYDSILLDFHKDDGLETLKQIQNIMSFDRNFPTKTYIGETYHDVKLLKIK